MASDNISPEEQRLATHEQEEPNSFESAVAESRVIDDSSPREGSPSPKVPLNQVGSNPHKVSPSHSITDDESNESRNWISAHFVIQTLEHAMKVACLELQSSPCFNDPITKPSKDTLVNTITMQFSNIAPTEIDNIFGFHDDGPAVLTAKIYIPESTIFTPESISTVHRTYVLSRPPYSVFIGREPGRTPAWILLNGPESSHVGPQRLTGAEREQLDKECDKEMHLNDWESSDLGLQQLSIFDLEQLDEEQDDEGLETEAISFYFGSEDVGF